MSIKKIQQYIHSDDCTYNRMGSVNLRKMWLSECFEDQWTVAVYTETQRT